MMSAHYPDMKGRIALVTGATAGIGYAVREMLHQQGVTVRSLAIDGDDLRCDLSDPDQMERAIDQIDTPLDYVVNAAGVDTTYSLEEGDCQHYDRIANLNLRAYYLVIRQSLPLLKQGQGKAIVNISSICYRLGVPGRSIYSATKAGILGLTTGLARELGAQGIRVNTITPGWVFTERQVTEHFTDSASRETNIATIKNNQAVDRQISPADIANHIVFYLSEASAASTGHNCVVDAGWLLE